MRSRFHEFWRWIGDLADAEAVFRVLSAAYSEPHRYYHTLEHIRCCLEDFAVVRKLAEQPECVEAAIWFHDVVYDPKRQDNEERSAQMACEVLRQAGVPEERRENVRRLILATKHCAPPPSRDEQLVTDVDLAILGKPAEIYDLYEKNIRREYVFVPDDDYRRGRTTVLHSFLERPSAIVPATPLRQPGSNRSRFA